MKCFLFLFFNLLAVIPALATENRPEIDFSVLREFKTLKPNNLRIEKLKDNQLLGKPLPLEGKIRAKDDVVAGREGSGTRGGGSGVVLNNEKVLALEVFRSLDLKKHPTFFSPNPDFFNQNAAVSSEQWSEYIVDQILEKVKDVLPIFYEVIEKSRITFNPSKWVDSNQRLPLIDDYIGDEISESHAQQVQIVYRIHDRFVFDKYLYAQMDGFNRAAIKLHEYIYAVSGLQESIKIQRLVSLLLSSNLESELQTLIDYRNKRIAEEVASRSKLLELLLNTGLTHLSSSTQKQLPKNIVEEPFVASRLLHFCGPIKNIEVDLKTKYTHIFFQLDTNNGQVDVFNMVPTSDQFLRNYQANKVGEIVLKDLQEVKTFLTALYYSTASLDRKFPQYVYPSRSFPASVICVNRWTGKLLSIDTVLIHSPKKTKRELGYASAEVEYIDSVAKSRKLWETLNSKEDDAFLRGVHLEYISSLMHLQEKKLDVVYSKDTLMTELSNNLSIALDPTSYFELLGRIQVKIDP